MDLSESGGEVHVGDPVRITDWAGYDNQPHFGPGGDYLLYTSIDDAGQADILRFASQFLYDEEDRIFLEVQAGKIEVEYQDYDWRLNRSRR